MVTNRAQDGLRSIRFEHGPTIFSALNHQRIDSKRKRAQSTHRGALPHFLDALDPPTASTLCLSSRGQTWAHVCNVMLKPLGGPQTFLSLHPVDRSSTLQVSIFCEGLGYHSLFLSSALRSSCVGLDTYDAPPSILLTRRSVYRTLCFVPIQLGRSPAISHQRATPPRQTILMCTDIAAW